MTAASSYRLFAALWIASLVIWWRAVAATVALSLRQDAYTHILLILPISILLIVLEWNKGKLTPRSNPRSGMVLLGLAVLIGTGGLRWGRPDIFTGDIRLSLEMLAIVLWWIGSFLCCFGSHVFKACIFPLFFLLWLVPIPDFALNYLVYHLQESSATTARLLFTMTGIPVDQNGTVLSIPGLSVEVAQECSSIRSSMMLVVASMVMSYLLLRSFWGKAFVSLAAIPLSIAKNGFRVFTLAALGAYMDRGILDSPLHHQGGILFLAMALTGVLALIWLVSWAERKTLHAAAR